MAIIKQIETFLKRFGSIRPTSGGAIVSVIAKTITTTQTTTTTTTTTVTAPTEAIEKV